MLPIINGEIIEDDIGCKVSLKVRMAWFTIAFMTVWLSIPFLGFLFGIYNWLSNGVFDGFYIAFLGSFICGYILMMFAHKIPAKECKDRLYQILKE